MCNHWSYISCRTQVLQGNVPPAFVNISAFSVPRNPSVGVYLNGSISTVDASVLLFSIVSQSVAGMFGVAPNGTLFVAMDYGLLIEPPTKFWVVIQAEGGKRAVHCLVVLRCVCVWIVGFEWGWSVREASGKIASRTRVRQWFGFALGAPQVAVGCARFARFNCIHVCVHHLFCALSQSSILLRIT